VLTFILELLSAPIRNSVMKMKNSSRKKIILVHGTWSPHATWIQQGSARREALKEHCQDCEEPIKFIWSGKNTVVARQAASDALINQIDPNSDQKYILIAHSHGGNVVLQALQGKINQKPVMDFVAGVICLNTPFFTLLRKDTQHLSSYVIISLITFLSCAIWYPFFIRDELSYWPVWSIGALALMYPMSTWLRPETIHRWIHKNFLYYGEKGRFCKIVTAPFLCLNCGADEAFAVLSVIDGISNIPSLLISRFWVSPALLNVFAILLVLRKFAIYVDLFGRNWIKSIEHSVFGFVIAIFKLPDLNGLGFKFTPHWPIIAGFLEICGLAALYAAVFLFSVCVLAIAFGALSEVSTGDWKKPILPLFVRQFVTLTPVCCENVEFYQLDVSDDETPLHSSLYNDREAIGHIVRWINDAKS
jgi:hypothetical protein